MTKGASLLLVASLAFNLAFVSAFAARRLRHPGPPPHTSRGPRRPDLDKVLSDQVLALKADQTTKVRQLSEDLLRQMDAQRAVLDTERGKLDALFEQAKPARAELEKQGAVVEAAQHELFARLLDHELKLHEVLTPTQIKRYHELMRPRHRGRGHGGPPRGPGPADKPLQEKQP